MEGDETRVVYRCYATLYFVFVVSSEESELGILDLIQVSARGARPASFLAHRPIALFCLFPTEALSIRTQVFVESLDRAFENVCELDLVFHFDEVSGPLIATEFPVAALGSRWQCGRI